MNDLEKTIRGHIFDIRERIEDIFALEEYFSFSHSDLTRTAEELRKCVEQGVVEFKRRNSTSLLSFFETLKYDSRGFDQISDFIKPMSAVVYTVLAQRLIAKGTLRGWELRAEEGSDSGIKDEDISMKEILADINRRVKENPEAEDDPKIKQILQQVKQYQKELVKKQSLMPNIPPDKLGPFEQNYLNIFNEIFRKIRVTYYSVLQAENEKGNAPNRQRRLSDFDLSSLTGVYQKQFELFSSLRSGLIYMVKERYKIRDTLVEFERKKDEFQLLLDEEEKKFSLIAPFDGDSKRIVNLYTAALIRLMERHASLLQAGL